MFVPALSSLFRAFAFTITQQWALHSISVCTTVYRSLASLELVYDVGASHNLALPAVSSNPPFVARLALAGQIFRRLALDYVDIFTGNHGLV
jgi:hypothetical protein